MTGIEGFVGAHLEARLAADGYEVWGTTLEEPPEGLERRVRCDVRQPEQVRSAFEESGAQAVVHLAARSSVATSHTDPLGTYDVNVGGALSVLECAREAELSGPVLLVGSGEVYGNLASDSPAAEEQPLAPLSPYAGSKAAQEAIGGQYARTYGLRVVMTRSFSHTGPGQDARFVFPSFARQLARLERAGGRGTLRVGNLTPVRDYLDVRDVARAYALLLRCGAAGDVVNVCSGRGFALRELLDELLELSTAEARVVEDAGLVREVEIHHLVGDPTRLRALGWEPEITPHRMLVDLLEHWRSRCEDQPT
ncbi:MAG: GDP-mannose 4,6-dehydratase [Gemmatimonadota bacterium]